MYHFIINPKSSSGKGIQHWWTAKKILDERNISYTENITKSTGHATQLAEQICSKHQGIKNIVVVGGDGTLNEVVNGIPNFDDVLLGYIPSGSSNDLARSLNIPRTPVEALENILKPTQHKFIDRGKITFLDQDLAPRTFCCSSGIGYDANVCYEVQQSALKKKLNQYGAGKFVYIMIALKQIITTKTTKGNILIDGVKKRSYNNILLSSHMIHKFEGGGLQMAPTADPCDRKLTVTLVHDISRLKLFLLLPTIFIGKHVKFSCVDTIHCSSIEVQLEDSKAIHTDGEVPAIGAHIKVECLPDQIRMIL